MDDTGKSASVKHYDEYKPYQQRVLDESIALREKIINLTQFLAMQNLSSLNVSEIEKCRLKHQLACMKMYYDVLGERIQAFE